MNPEENDWNKLGDACRLAAKAIADLSDVISYIFYFKEYGKCSEVLDFQYSCDNAELVFYFYRN